MAGLATSYTGLSFNGGFSWAAESIVSGRSFDFSVLTLGTDGTNFAGPLHGRASTLVTEVNFKTGVVRQSQIPLSLAHAPQYLPGGRILALSAHTRVSLVLNSDHSVVQELTVPENFVFAGHSLVLEDRGWLVVSVKNKVSKSIKDTGYLSFLDLKTFREKHRIATHSTFGHDIERLSKIELAVSHYGTLLFDLQKSDQPVVKSGIKYLMNVVKPMVSYFDLDTMKYTEHRELGPLHALNHISHGPEKSLYAISVQAVGRDPQSVKFAIDRFKDPRLLQQDDSEVPSKTFLFLPSPLTWIPLKGAPSEHWGPASAHVRGHDIVADPTRHWVAATFPGSQTVGILKDKTNLELHPGTKWGLASPRAVALSVDARQLIICDQNEGIVIADKANLETLASARLPLFKTVHVDIRSNDEKTSA